jgi:hypothetical protein
MPAMDISLPQHLGHGVKSHVLVLYAEVLLAPHTTLKLDDHTYQLFAIACLVSL